MKTKNLALIIYSIITFSCAYLGNTNLIPHKAKIGKTGYKAKSEKSDLEAGLMASFLDTHANRDILFKIDTSPRDRIINEEEYKAFRNNYFSNNN